MDSPASTKPAGSSSAKLLMGGLNCFTKMIAGFSPSCIAMILTASGDPTRVAYSHSRDWPAVLVNGTEQKLSHLPSYFGLLDINKVNCK